MNREKNAQHQIKMNRTRKQTSVNTVIKFVFVGSFSQKFFHRMTLENVSSARFCVRLLMTYNKHNYYHASKR